MAEAKENDFLDSLEEAMAEEFAEQDAEIEDEALEIEQLREERVAGAIVVEDELPLR